MVNIPTRLFALLVVISSIIQCTETYQTSVFAYEDNCNYVSSCSCYDVNDGLFICTSYADWNGVATFNDPIPKGDYRITNVTLTFKGDAYCHVSGDAALFYMSVKLNGVVLNSLRSARRYGCNCECDVISNSTLFLNLGGLPAYNWQGKNYIFAKPLSGTIACFQGWTITLTYVDNGLPSATSSISTTASRSGSISRSVTLTGSHTPSATRSISISDWKTPKPSISPSISLSPSPIKSPNPPGFMCCVYVNSISGLHDITCAKSCFPQSEYELIASIPTNDCSICFT